MEFQTKWFSIHIGTFNDLILSIAEVGLVLAIADGLERKNTYYYYPPQPIERHNFSKPTQEITKIRQGLVCNSCKKKPEFWEFHHRDGLRSNNRPSNCEGLCPNCHRKIHSKK